MVQAILQGTKTVTRRVCRNQCIANIASVLDNSPFKPWPVEKRTPDKCPYGKPGDILWVRETFAMSVDRHTFSLKAHGHRLPHGAKWKPSIHMPKSLSMVWLQIQDVRVERLHDITEDDAIAEGVCEYNDGTFKNYFTQKGLTANDGVECLLAKGSFQSLWCSINGIESWNQNPWVWVVSFKVLTTTGNLSSIQ